MRYSVYNKQEHSSSPLVMIQKWLYIEEFKHCVWLQCMNKHNYIIILFDQQVETEIYKALNLK